MSPNHHKPQDFLTTFRDVKTTQTSQNVDSAARCMVEVGMGGSRSPWGRPAACWYYEAFCASNRFGVSYFYAFVVVFIFWFFVIFFDWHTLHIVGWASSILRGSLPNELNKCHNGDKKKWRFRKTIVWHLSRIVMCHESWRVTLNILQKKRRKTDVTSRDKKHVILLLKTWHNAN